MKFNKIAGCVFCQPNIEAVFAESEHFFALYNIAPILPGHSLVVPKGHVESLMDLNETELAEFMIFGRDVAKLLISAFKTPAFNWTIQEKEPAGQTIPHLHMHVIPRVSGDLERPGDWYPLVQRSEHDIIDSAQRPQLTQDQIRKIVSEIQRLKN